MTQRPERCPKCDREIAIGATPCPHCGHVILRFGKAAPGPGSNVTPAGFIAAALVFLLVFGLFTTCGDDRPTSPATKQPFPPHRVAGKSSLAPQKGMRIQLDVDNPSLTESECLRLLAAYREEAGPAGQVSVHRPSKLLGGQRAPWCVDNADEDHIRFQDALFGDPSKPVGPYRRVPR